MFYRIEPTFPMLMDSFIQNQKETLASLLLLIDITARRIEDTGRAFRSSFQPNHRFQPELSYCSTLFVVECHALKRCTPDGGPSYDSFLIGIGLPAVAFNQIIDLGKPCETPASALASFHSPITGLGVLISGRLLPALRQVLR